MKVSVLVIAHNEEAHIGACLDALAKQTQAPDEIVLVAHNCTDRTEEIAGGFPHVRVVPYAGPAGAIYARMKGFEEVKGDVILCTDADTVVSSQWVTRMAAPFADARVAGASSVVDIVGVPTRNALTTFWNFNLVWFAGFVLPFARPWPMWGASMAVRTSAYERIGGLHGLLDAQRALALETCPDDYYLSIRLRQVGKVPLVFGARVRAVSKEESAETDLARWKVQQREGRRLYAYLKRTPLPA